MFLFLPMNCQNKKKKIIIYKIILDEKGCRTVWMQPLKNMKKKATSLRTQPKRCNLF